MWGYIKKNPWKNPTTWNKQKYFFGLHDWRKHTHNKSYKLDFKAESYHQPPKKNLDFLRSQKNKSVSSTGWAIQPETVRFGDLWLSGFNWRQPFCGMDGNCLGKIQLSSTTHYHRTNTFIHGYGLDVPVQEMEGTTSFRPLFS